MYDEQFNPAALIFIVPIVAIIATLMIKLVIVLWRAEM